MSPQWPPDARVHVVCPRNGEWLVCPICKGRVRHIFEELMRPWDPQWCPTHKISLVEPTQSSRATA